MGSMTDDEKREASLRRRRELYQLNKHKHKAYAEKNKERRRKYLAEYREKNREKLRVYLREYNAKNPEKQRQSRREWIEKNKARRLEISRKSAEKHKVKKRIQSAAWAKANKDRLAFLNSKRRYGKRVATPKWTNEFFMQEAASLARKRTKITGFKWHVDHIVPIQSPLVCGLNTHTNVQVIPARDNISKNNRYWPDMP